MDINLLNTHYTAHPAVITVQKELVTPGTAPLLLEGLSGSASSMVMAAIYRPSVSTHLVIMRDKEEAAYFYNDLFTLCGDESIYFFPSAFKRSVVHEQSDPGNILLRSSALNFLASGKRKCIIVSYPEALVEKVVSRKTLTKSTLSIKPGDNLSIEFIEEALQEYNFSRTEFVSEPGHYSVRGSLVDLFSFSGDKPARIDFFGDTVDSIRLFDPDTQLSSETISAYTILPDLLAITTNEESVSILEFIPPSSYVWIDNPEMVLDQMNAIYSLALSKNESGALPVSIKTLIDGREFSESIKPFRLIELGGTGYSENITRVAFRTEPQPQFNKNFELVVSANRISQQNGYSSIILAENDIQIDRLKDIFKEISPDVSFEYIRSALHRGFTDHDLKLSVLTDHQIFDRYHKFRIRGSFTRKESLALKELTGLNPGDYIVHIDHGIGRFGGLEKIEVNGKVQETIRLVFKDNDILFVGIHSLHRISKYRGKDSAPPKINKLGTGAWQKLKSSAKSKVKDIARELILLYSTRLKMKGFSFSPDSYLQRELEASFIYEDTPDQETATSTVKTDMESAVPMDRLVCGDVGFGKTEIAIRAAFKAATDGKQTAVLVPTTILALQHYKTFSSRLKGFPVRVEYISRHRKASDQKTIFEDLKNGKIDIIIGTHKLVGKEVGFKDLGLLVIDEEQRFGVAVKEKLKKLKANVDTLTLTATPIPRTLQFSLMGARDLSVISTPPPNRMPIVTELHGFNEEIIREGIEYELSRNGQVFFIHNRVQNINDLKATLLRIVPGVKIVIVHGQLEGKDIENRMYDFIYGDYDILLATTIVESGLDIPNANTIFINDAHNFGLSELHQLRGRVGRSNKKAFCYLLTPPMSNVSSEAKRRLKAIEEFAELGSGFNIALQDLDIRGSGNILGGEQSGFIADIGFETYQRILQEAITELREEEFPSMEAKQYDLPQDTAGKGFSDDVTIDSDMEIMLPESYVSNIPERIRLYKELNEIRNEESLTQFGERMNDRFGKIPPQVLSLFDLVRIKWVTSNLGIEKVVLKNGIMILHFISNPDSLFYKSEIFIRVMGYVNTRPRRMEVKQKNSKLSLYIRNITTTSVALTILREMESAAKN